MVSSPPWRRRFLKKHLVDQSISASMTENAGAARAPLTDDLPVLQTASRTEIDSISVAW
jgi:hypothetical protein